MRRLVVLVLAATLGLFGCAKTAPEDTPAPVASDRPPQSLPAADTAATALAAALTAHDLTKLQTVDSPADAQADLETIFAGMDDIWPTVTTGSITYDGADGATASLDYVFDLGLHGWKYTSTAPLRWVTDAWRVDWQPSIVQPDLTPSSRLRHTHTPARRGAINDNSGNAIMEERPLYEVGLDKSGVNQSDWKSAAEKLAGLLKIDKDAYLAKVEANGPKAFVVGATLRQDAIPGGVADAQGVLVREIRAVLGPSDKFAAPILGSVGAPTAAMIEESKGALTSSDIVGLSGLQARYDSTLRGVPRVAVDVVPRKGISDEAAAAVAEKTVFQQDDSASAPIDTSLDRELQEKAERILKDQAGTAALVVIDLKDGGLLTAAQSEKAGAYPHATFGKYAPGSTFKVATSLAMIRNGMNASSSVDCRDKLKVGTYTFGNYNGYPSSGLGKVPMSTAFKYSCNTAFAGSNVNGQQLGASAASLGVGVDYDAGFAAYFGNVKPGNSIDLAASKIGQGQVTMSPLGMAAVAATVGSGQTTVPWLVKGKQAKATSTPLSAHEAKELQTLMRATVDSGTATQLKGIMTGAKSGTAQWGPSGKLKTSAWMIAYNKDVAVAAFVENGDSGGKTAAPLIAKLFS